MIGHRERPTTEARAAVSGTLATSRNTTASLRPAARSGYTAVVGSWMRRAVSVATVVALGGGPEIAAACAALCIPGAADDTGHGEDHGSMHKSAQHDDPSHAPRLQGAASDPSCCAHTDSALSASLPAARGHRGAFAATPSVLATAIGPRIPLPGELSYDSSVLPPYPTSAPLVLRI